MPVLTQEALEALRAEVKAVKAPILNRERAAAIAVSLDGVRDPVEAVEVMVTHGFLPVDWTNGETARLFEHPQDPVVLILYDKPTIQNGRCSLRGSPKDRKALEALGMTQPDEDPMSARMEFPARALDPELFRIKDHSVDGALAIHDGRLCPARGRRRETYPASVAQVATLAYHARAVATAENLYREMLAFMDAPADTSMCWGLRVGRFQLRAPGPVRSPYMPTQSRRLTLLEPSIIFRPADPTGYRTGSDWGSRRDNDNASATIARVVGVPEEYLRGGNGSAPQEMSQVDFRRAVDELRQTVISRRASPSLLIQDIVRVQPMTAPVGAIFYLDSVYGSPMQAPEPLRNRYSYYSVAVTDGILRGSSSTYNDTDLGGERAYLAPWLVALWQCAVEHPKAHTLTLDPRGFPWS